jgi:hypothetical protein
VITEAPLPAEVAKADAALDEVSSDIRLSGLPVEFSAEVTSVLEGELHTATYKTRSLPGAARSALRDKPGAEILSVRRIITTVEPTEPTP